MHGTDGAPVPLWKSVWWCPSHLNKTQIYGVLTLGIAVEYMDMREKLTISLNPERGTWIIHRLLEEFFFRRSCTAVQ